MESCILILGQRCKLLHSHEEHHTVSLSVSFSSLLSLGLGKLDLLVSCFSLENSLNVEVLGHLCSDIGGAESIRRVSEDILRPSRQGNFEDAIHFTTKSGSGDGVN